MRRQRHSGAGGPDGRHHGFPRAHGARAWRDDGDRRRRAPIADALVAQVSLLGWDAAVETRPDMVEGLTTRLSSADAVVVMGHDVETSSRCLQVALDSDAGYIGGLGLSGRCSRLALTGWPIGT